METIKEFFHFLFHLNDELGPFIQEHGSMIYLVFFLVIFVETGLVIMPFLPGDSLLFVAGTFAARGDGGLNIYYLIGLLFIAAILGDNLNYFVGRFFGQRVTKWKLFGRILVKPEWIEKTKGYFDKYGVRTIIIARFIPIVRTITPFVAGVGEMRYRTFLPYDILGGFLWISLLSLAGYFFGQTEFVQKHYEAVILGIIFISVLPMAIEVARNFFGKKKA